MNISMSTKRNRSFSSSRVAFYALTLSVLTACGGGQGGMKMGDDEFAVESTCSCIQQSDDPVSRHNQRFTGY